MIELTIKEVAEQIVALKLAMAEIDRLNENVGALQVALDNTLRERDALQRIAAELNAENVGLKQTIARLEVNDEQPVYRRIDL